jgi:hypothetical protein
VSYHPVRADHSIGFRERDTDTRGYCFLPDVWMWNARTCVAGKSD